MMLGVAFWNVAPLALAAFTAPSTRLAPRAPPRSLAPACSARSFHDLGVRAEIVEALSEMGVTAPNAPEKV